MIKYIVFLFTNFLLTKTTTFLLNSVISDYASPEMIDDLKLKASYGLSSRLFCSGKGQYLNSKCECYKGFTGERCEFSDSNPEDFFCNLKGKYNDKTKKCDCFHSHNGENCEYISCNGNGILMNDKCYCFKSYMGESCEFELDKNFCSNHGFIRKSNAINYTYNDECLCYTGYNGYFCENYEKPGDYNSLLNYLKETIMGINAQKCEFGYTGNNCKYHTISAKCNFHGFFDIENNVCICFENYMGKDCENTRFDSYCNNKGYLKIGAYLEKKCICDKNVYGERCEYVRCQGNGEYIQGKFCKCFINYGGENCDIKLVDDECSNLGISFTDYLGNKKCLCLANYIDDNCELSKNSNLTINGVYHNNTHKNHSLPKDFIKKINVNSSNPELEEQLLSNLENGILEMGDIFNKELKNAAEYLNSIKPNYDGILSEYLDFFSGKIPTNMVEAIENYQYLIAKATTPDSECNDHGHRLHYISEKNYKEDKREEIYSIGKTKIAIYFSNNSTFDDFFKTKLQPLYEKIICQCENGFSGTYCEIASVEKDWLSELNNNIYQENIRKILEQEEDITVQKFEKDNEIIFYNSDNSTTNSDNYAEFYGIANEKTKFLDKKELELDSQENIPEKNKKNKKYEILEFIFS